MSAKARTAQPANEESTLTKARARWIELVHGNDVDSYVGMMSDDIVWLPPGMDAIEGREAMRTWLAPAFKSYSSDLRLVVSRSAVHGDRAVEEGAFDATLTEKTTGEQQSHGGRYVAMWRRSPEGWLLDRYADLGRADE